MNPTELTPKLSPPEYPKRCGAGITIYENKNPNREGGVEYKVAFIDVDGKRKFRSCDTPLKAKAMVKEIKDLKKKGVLEILKISKTDLAALARAKEALAEAGIDLDLAAIEYAAAKKALGARSVLATCEEYANRMAGIKEATVRQVADEMIADAQKRGLSKPYISDLRTRLGRISDAFHQEIHTIQKDDVKRFLNSLGLSPRSYNNFLRVLRSLWIFAANQRYVPKDNGVIEGEKLCKDTGSKIGILKPKQMEALLKAANPDLAPVLAICGFAGLRNAEVMRLTWEDIDLPGRFIEVSKTKAKTASRRLAPITDNLAQWLAPYAGKTGPVWSHSHPYYFEALQNTLDAAGIKNWPQNCLRHSFVSYRIKLINNVHKVSDECGNSPSMIHGHYRELVRDPEAAAKWFSINPESPANVVPMATAALSS